MPDFPSRPQYFDVFADELLTRAEARPYGDRITPEQVYTEGSDINLIGAGASAMAEEVSRQAAKELTNLTLDGASGDALDRWIADRYSTEIVRKTASPAIGVLRFTRSSIAAGATTFSSGSTVQDAGGNRFRTLADAAFGASDLGPIDVNAEAVDAGIAGNAPANTITSFVTAPNDATMAVTNPVLFAGGSSTESDESLRKRARQFWAQARRGTEGAIEFGALTVPGVAQATAEAQRDDDGFETGLVYCYIADVNGQSNLTLENLTAEALLEYRAAGIVVNIFGAVPTYITISLSLSYQSGTDTAAAWQAVKSTIIARVNLLAPGETLYVSLIIEAARSVTGVIVADDAVIVPAGDIVPLADQIIRTRSDLITAA
jgi:uncharacterized phage protein gp47/JayE